VVDEVTRAVPNLISKVEDLKGRPEEARKVLAAFHNQKNLDSLLERVCQGLRGQSPI
jgi:phosphopantothenate synthetase